MEEYILITILLVLFLAVIIFTRYLNKPVKGIFIIYYLVLGSLFVIVKERIENAYNTATTPNINWIVNNEWIADIRHLLFVPMIGLLIYLLYKGYTDPKEPWERSNILGVTIPLAALLAALYFLFSYTYGYYA
ncbi:hypothetical protein [Terribacillus saccharophilus]|uniref:Uncharacterized protein n=1 Tax=Terribacillus saccharophilus TaxID=361277 RepID=A0A268AAN1_9BACI|nr:hypothetical protein [Terribacillus saccharophilus]PAD21183.1 hypothetical protein CHH64_09620 [Terribacillus saccharophilus]PAF36210.1 hypothetical protein CHH58_13575 [Terribacillus saccharophilus]